MSYTRELLSVPNIDVIKLNKTADREKDRILLGSSLLKSTYIFLTDEDLVSDHVTYFLICKKLGVANFRTMQDHLIKLRIYNKNVAGANSGRSQYQELIKKWRLKVNNGEIKFAVRAKVLDCKPKTYYQPKFSSVDIGIDGIDIIGVEPGDAGKIYPRKLLNQPDKLKDLITLVTDSRLVCDSINYKDIPTIIGACRTSMYTKLSLFGLDYSKMRINPLGDSTNYCKMEIEQWRNKVKNGEIKFAVKVKSKIKERDVEASSPTS